MSSRFFEFSVRRIRAGMIRILVDIPKEFFAFFEIRRVSLASALLISRRRNGHYGP